MTRCAEKDACATGQLCLQEPNGIACICRYGFIRGGSKECRSIEFVVVVVVIELHDCLY